MQLECLKNSNCKGYAYKKDEDEKCRILNNMDNIALKDAADSTIVTAPGWTMYACWCCLKENCHTGDF